MKITYTPQAEQDIIEIASWYASKERELAGQFIIAVQATAESLKDMPLRGTRRIYENPYLQNMRVLKISGFERRLLFYETGRQNILIVRVLSGEQNLVDIFGA